MHIFSRVHYHPFFSQVVLVIHISSTNVDILPPRFHKLCTLYTASFSKPAHGRRTCFSQPVHFICTICARYTQQNASAYTVAATSSKTTAAAHSLTDISLFCPQAIQTMSNETSQNQQGLYLEMSFGSPCPSKSPSLSVLYCKFITGFDNKVLKILNNCMRTLYYSAQSSTNSEARQVNNFHFHRWSVCLLLQKRGLLSKLA